MFRAMRSAHEISTSPLHQCLFNSNVRCVFGNFLSHCSFSSRLIELLSSGLNRRWETICRSSRGRTSLSLPNSGRMQRSKSNRKAASGLRERERERERERGREGGRERERKRGRENGREGRSSLITSQKPRQESRLTRPFLDPPPRASLFGDRPCCKAARAATKDGIN